MYGMLWFMGISELLFYIWQSLYFFLVTLFATIILYSVVLAIIIKKR